MIRDIFLTSILLVQFFNVSSQNRWTKKEQQVQQVITDLFQALSDRDFDKLKANCTSDITVLENGITWNLDTLEQKINSTKAIPDFNRSIRSGLLKRG